MNPRPQWLAAAPLMFVAATLPLFGLITFGAWWTGSFSNWPDFQGSMFWYEFSDNLGDLWVCLAVPAVVVLEFLVRRKSFTTWPVTCVYLAVWFVIVVLLGANLPDGSVLAHLALGAGLVGLNYALGRLTVKVLSRTNSTG